MSCAVYLPFFNCDCIIFSLLSLSFLSCIFYCFDFFLFNLFTSPLYSLLVSSSPHPPLSFFLSYFAFIIIVSPPHPIRFTAFVLNLPSDKAITFPMLLLFSFFNSLLLCQCFEHFASCHVSTCGVHALYDCHRCSLVSVDAIKNNRKRQKEMGKFASFVKMRAKRRSLTLLQ